MSAPTTTTSSRKIYIMRHGERVDFNFGTWVVECFDIAGNYARKDLNMPKVLPKRKNSPDSWNKDTPLTNMGLHQARLTGEALLDANEQIEHVYCSPAFRSLQTCASVVEGLGKKEQLKIKIEPGLFEQLCWYPNGMPEALTNDELKAAGYNIDSDYVPVYSETQLKLCNKETLTEFYTRNHRIVSEILTKTSGNVLLVGHSITLDACSRLLIGEEPRSMRNTFPLLQRIPYCGIVTVQQETGSDKWELVQPACLPLTHAKNMHFDWKLLTSKEPIAFTHDSDSTTPEHFKQMAKKALNL